MDVRLMETPDLTLEDAAGGAGALSILMLTLQSPNVAVQITGTIMIGLIGLGIIAAGAYRRGKRAENLVDTVHFLDTGSTGALEEE
jgi:hypothetical protein